MQSDFYKVFSTNHHLPYQSLDIMLDSFLCDPFYPSFTADLLIAFLGAFLGLVAAYLIYKYSVNRSREDRLKYIVSLVLTIVPSIKRQATYCKEYADTIKQSPFLNENLKLEANRDTKRLSDKVDQEGVFHAFLWKYKRSGKTYKDFQSLYSYLDYIDYLIDDLIKTNERILMFTWERKKEYQLTFKKAKESIQSLVLIPELENNQLPLVTFAGNLLETFSQNQPEGENIVASYEVVVKPLQEYIIANAKQHIKITELLFQLQDLSNMYYGMELSAKHNADDYLHYASELEKAGDKLTDSSKTLQEDFQT